MKKFLLLIIIFCSFYRLVANSKDDRIAFSNFDRNIQASSYCEFLNVVAAATGKDFYNEKMATDFKSACIMCAGTPDSRYYYVIKEKEKNSVAFMSYRDVVCYYSWHENISSTFDFDFYNTNAIDPLIKSNQIYFTNHLEKKIVNYHASSGKWQEGSKWAEEIGALLMSTLFGERTRRISSETSDHLQREIGKHNSTRMDSHGALIAAARENASTPPLPNFKFPKISKKNSNSLSFKQDREISKMDDSYQDDVTDTSNFTNSKKNDSSLSPVNENANNSAFANGNLPWNLRKIGVCSAWDILSKKQEQSENEHEDLHILIFDTGIDAEHPVLRNYMWRTLKKNGRAIYGYNACDDSDNTEDNNGHGTKCGGIISAVLGHDKNLSKQVKLMVCKICNENTYTFFLSDLLKSMEWAIGERWAKGENREAKKNIKIINCSMGRYPGNNVQKEKADNMLEDKLSAIRDKGIIVVTSAGDSKKGERGTDNDERCHYPSNYGRIALKRNNNMEVLKSEGLTYPNVVAVAATTEDDMLLQEANYGKQTVHLGAPGDSIPTIVPSNLARNYKSTCTGSSAAGPHVSAACALMMQIFLNASTHNDIIDAFYRSGVSIQFAKGREIASGRLDIAAALEYMKYKKAAGLEIPQNSLPLEQEEGQKLKPQDSFELPQKELQKEKESEK
jgi:hypothetical protein